MKQSIREKVVLVFANARTPGHRELRGDDLAHAVAYHGADADAVITAFLEAAAEQGWHMRPDEAVPGMFMEPARINENWRAEMALGDVYRTMLAAAPKFEWDK